MMKKDKAKRDTFALSLGGVTVVTTVAAMPAISYDQLRQDPSRTASNRRPLNWRARMPRRFRVV